VPNYRVAAYNYLSRYLRGEGYSLTVVSEGTEEGNTHKIEFHHQIVPLTFLRLSEFIIKTKPNVVIYWVHLRHLYLFPILCLIKILGVKSIYWGHGTDLAGKGMMSLKNLAHSAEYFLSNALILYGEHLKAFVDDRFHKKTFVANNTINFNNYKIRVWDKEKILSDKDITTRKNIICMGRMQRRKGIGHLLRAFQLIKGDDIGLILVGPDSDGILCNIHGDNIYKLGPIYGDKMLDLLSAADVFCLPGAVGLSIVDAFYCGLPIVTEEGDVSPETMYLKEGINGFVVPRGDIGQLAEKLALLLDDDDLRKRFSKAAIREINRNGNMDRMCQGFSEALRFVCNRKG
jgi:glycosyltransferase involved in cell wall biosynthesis